MPKDTRYGFLADDVHSFCGITICTIEFGNVSRFFYVVQGHGIGGIALCKR